MPEIRLIIFDLDGTLVDSLTDLTEATNHMLASFGRPLLSPAGVRLLVGEGARRLVEKGLRGASEEEVEQGLALFLAYNEAHIADHSTLYPGVPETLSTLAAAGLRLAVISNKNALLCRKLLAELKVDRFFAGILGGDSLPSRKPSPEPVLKVLRDCGVTPAEAVMVGDSINDVAAGQGAGVVTVGCSYGFGSAEELAGADYRISAFPELLQLPIFKQKSVDSGASIS